MSAISRNTVHAARVAAYCGQFDEVPLPSPQCQHRLSPDQTADMRAFVGAKAARPSAAMAPAGGR